jgi:hypothetical protein
MSLLQAMTASESELMRKLAGVYRQHGLTDAQAADDLLGVIGLFPEVADEIPGFQKVANPLRALVRQPQAGAGLLKTVAPRMPVRPAAFPSAAAPVAPMAARTRGLSPRLVPQAAPAARVPAPPPPRPATSVPAPKPAPGLKPIDQERLAWEEDRVWRAQNRHNMGAVPAEPLHPSRVRHIIYDSRNRASAGTPPVGTPPVGTPPVGTPPVGTPPVGNFFQRNVTRPLANTASTVWNNKGRVAGGLALSGGVGGGIGAAGALSAGQDPVMGFVGGAVPSMVGSAFMPPGVAGLAGGLTSSAANGTGVTAAAQAGLRQTRWLPDAVRDLGIPRDFTGGQDPTRATSAAGLDSSVSAGGESLNNLRPTMVTPKAQAAQAAQEAMFAQKAMNPELQKTFPQANPRSALDYTLPGATDPVLSDPTLKAEISAALAQPGGLEKFGRATTDMEAKLIGGIKQLDPADAKFQLANLSKRRLAFTAAATGMDTKTLVQQAGDIDARLQAGEQLTPQDLDFTLKTPAGREFFQQIMAEHGGVPGTGVAAPPALPDLSAGRGLRGVTPPAAAPAAAPAAPVATPNVGGAVVPPPAGGAAPGGGVDVPAPTADPAAPPQDMAAIFQRIGEFAANNKTQFAALALGIPIALSGLAMTMSGGPSLGGILALILGGGMAAGGMGQFGGTDLMSPLQSFFGGGAPAAPPPPSLTGDPAAAQPSAAAAAPTPVTPSVPVPTGGAAVSPAATFQGPNISDTAAQPLGV